jgi:hypothetical protein
VYYIEAVEDSEVLLLHPDFINKLIGEFPDSLEKVISSFRNISKVFRTESIPFLQKLQKKDI